MTDCQGLKIPRPILGRENRSIETLKNRRLREEGDPSCEGRRAHNTPRTRLTPEFRPVRNGCPVGSVAALLPVV